jgi:hypothetical protein
MVFRHLLRLILLLVEFTQLTPPETTGEDWRAELEEIGTRLTESCRSVDPASTDNVLAQATGGED